jgi:O-methyltransferase involved in polyketide biosynthesis
MCCGVGARSRYLDDLLVDCVRTRGLAAVLSVGCGLDSRPWRLDLPASLHWIEVDFPAMLDYKAAVMAGEPPKCRLTRLAAGLNDAGQWREIFAAVAGAPSLMITGGLLSYLPAATIEALAAEPAALSGIRCWMAGLTPPAFARAVGVDSFRPFQHVRSAGYLDGLRILDVLQRHGWASLECRSFIAGALAFAAGCRGRAGGRAWHRRPYRLTAPAGCIASAGPPANPGTDRGRAAPRRPVTPAGAPGTPPVRLVQR